MPHAVASEVDPPSNAPGTRAPLELPPAPTPCLWQGCPLLLWHVGPHLSRNTPVASRIESRDGGRLVYWHVKDADRKGFIGATMRGRHAEVAPRRWIRLFGTVDGQAIDRAFAIGDEAAYDGYNLTYTGVITNIGNQTVTIRDGRTVKRLSICSFHVWNWNFDAARVRAENLDTLQRL